MKLICSTKFIGPTRQGKSLQSVRAPILDRNHTDFGPRPVPALTCAELSRPGREDFWPTYHPGIRGYVRGYPATNPGEPKHARVHLSMSVLTRVYPDDVEHAQVYLGMSALTRE